MTHEIYWLPEIDGHRSAIVARPQPGEPSQAAQAWKSAGIGVILSLLSADEVISLGLEGEADACAAAGIEFITYPVADFSVPDSATRLADVFERLVARMQQGQAVGIHCRGSIGRSGMVASCLLAHLGMEGETAIQRVSEARGHVVPELPAQKQWILAFAAESAKKRSTSAE